MKIFISTINLPIFAIFIKQLELRSQSYLTKLLRSAAPSVVVFANQNFLRDLDTSLADISEIGETNEGTSFRVNTKIRQSIINNV